MPKHRFPDDPFAKREARKYERPIPSRELILACLGKKNVPMDVFDIAKALEIEHEEDMEALRRRLRAMERDVQVLCNRRGTYGLVDKLHLIAGKVHAHRDGYGFVIPEDGSKDLYLSSRQMESLFHGDKVLAHIISKDKNGRLSGGIVEIVERGVKQVVGRYLCENGVGMVIPEDRHVPHDILIPQKHKRGCKVGDMVVVSITRYPDKHVLATGKVLEILGQHLGPGTEIDVAIRAHQLPYEWSSAAKQQAKRLAKTIPSKALEGRQDLRHLSFVTIDGEDAKDFDDAVYCELKDTGGFRLFVAIADVSHYVQVGSPLDEAAYERGTSVYFPERVIPMLPEELSNDLCSLKEKVDRLCLVCEASIDKQGHVRRFRFFPAIIHSKARLTYTLVANLLDKPSQTQKKQYAELLPHLQHLHALYNVLWKRREERFALEFISMETKVLFDEAQKIKAIIPVERNVAHRLIEECMLVANVCAARFVQQHQLPALYRIHAKPTLEKLTDIRAFLSGLGLHLGGGKEVSAQHFAAVLAKAEGRKDVPLIHQVLLRSLSRAQYSPDNIGHFGLAYAAYAHFTSPIRRYPDLLLHRAIYHQLQKTEDTSDSFYTPQRMQQLGEQSSFCEQRADEATRDVMLWLKCEYMLDKLGDSFTGVISGVTSFGFFVTLENIWVDGLVHVANLPNDYYAFDHSTQSLVGERTGVRYRLGDKLTVVVARVDLDERKIDLALKTS